MEFGFIIAILSSLGVIGVYVAYMCLKSIEPYEPDDIRFRAQIPVVVRVDTRIVPMQTVAEYVNPQYYVDNAVSAEEPDDKLTAIVTEV